MSVFPARILPAARKWPIFVMQLPMKTSSILSPATVGQELHVVRIVRAGDDRLLDLVQVDLDDGRVFRVGVGFEQLRIGEPGLHLADAPLQRAAILIAVGGHPFQQRHVRADVFDHRLLVEAHGGGGGGALGGRVGQFERLLDFQVLKPLDLQDRAGEDVLLALLLDGEKAASGWRRRGWRSRGRAA